MFYLGALLLIGLDQLTKLLVVGALPFGQPQPVLPFLRFTYVTNTGAAFSLLTGFPWLLAGIATVVSVGILWYVASRGKTLGARIWPLLLLFSGAVGNLIDRVTRGGAVVDFLEFGPADPTLGGWWPVFNLADSMVVIGAVLLVLLPPGTPRRDRQSELGPGRVDASHHRSLVGEETGPKVGASEGNPEPR